VEKQKQRMEWGLRQARAAQIAPKERIIRVAPQNKFGA
jgi:hypothetical protein